MKFACLGDVHFGLNSDSQHRLKFQLDYLENVVIKYLIDNNIKNVIQLGDLFHSRKTINVNTFHWTKKRFLDVLQKHNIKMYVIVGNHDAYYTQSNEVTTLSILKEYENIVVVEEPTMFEFEDDYRFSMVPWIANDEDEKNLKSFIRQNPHNICFGHFEFKNFEVIPGHTMDHGLNASIFKNFDVVYSGHYHNKQQKGNVNYLGTPYEMTWHDYESPKGFYVIDTKTRGLEYIQNHDTLFEKIYYDEDFQEKALEDLKSIEDKIVKIYVVKKTKESLFSNFLYELEQAKPYSFSIIETEEVSDNYSVGDDNKKIIDVIEDYLEELGRDDKEPLMKVFNILYKKVLEEQ